MRIAAVATLLMLSQAVCLLHNERLIRELMREGPHSQMPLTSAKLSLDKAEN